AGIGQRLATSPGERPERRVQTGPRDRQLDALPQADRVAGLVQPDLGDQRHRPEPGAGPDDLQRGRPGLGAADHDGPPGRAGWRGTPARTSLSMAGADAREPAAGPRRHGRWPGGGVVATVDYPGPMMRGRSHDDRDNHRGSAGDRGSA